MQKIIIALVLIFLFTPIVEAKKIERFRPYQLVSSMEADYATSVTMVRQKLNDSAFEIVGEYSPYENAHIFAITHPALLKSAAASDLGGFGAVLRMSVTEVEGATQIAYVTPIYMTNLYRIPEVPEVDELLQVTFGKTTPYGSKKGKSRRALSGYQYMMFMPEFDDQDTLGKFKSHEEALATINKNLLNTDTKLNKIFQVAIPGKDEVLIGVGIMEGEGGDAHIMSVIDQSELRHTAHLPYAVLISGDTAYALAGKFRIASAFPDLTMGTFMDISDAPDDIKNQLSQLAK